ncbi:MAG TPA: LuxR C-terminal-related transcriptional regulator, partial [Umezawaea sp.]|nr:LuxR C-terminal-related transcriptional regulator [Umezawaea sp.]
GELGPGSPLLAGSAALAWSALAPTPYVLPDSGRPESYAVQHGLYWLAVNLMSTGEPLVLVVDDVQWCDEWSLSWLGFLLRRAENLPLRVLLTQRSAEPVRGPLADLVALPNCRLIDLGPLPTASVGDLITATTGVVADEEFVLRCAEVSGGYPLLLDRLLGELRAAGTTFDRSGARKVAEVGRLVMADSVLGSLRRMSPHARAVARALAALGGEAAELVAGLAGVSDHVLDSAVRELRGDRILCDTTVELRHDTIRAAVLDACTPDELTALHTKAAVLLNDAGRPAEDVACQLHQLPKLTERWMLGVLRDAATSAESRGAPAAGARHLIRALELEPAGPSIRTHLARVLAQSDPDAAVRHLVWALSLVEDVRARATIALQLGLACLAVHRAPQAVTTLTGVLDRLDEVIGDEPSAADGELRVLLESALLIAGIGSRPTAPAAMARVRAMPAPDGVTLGERQALGVMAAIGALDGARAASVVERAERAVRGEFFAPGGWSLMGSALALHLADEVDSALRVLDTLMVDAQTNAQTWTLHMALTMRSSVWLWRGHLAEAAADAQTAIEIAEQSRWGTNPTMPDIVLATVLAHRLEAPRAQTLLDRVGRPKFEDCTLEYHGYLMAAARTRLWLNDLDGALALLERCGTSLAEAGVRNPVFAPWWFDAACVLAQLGRAGEGRELVESVAEQADLWGTPRARGMVLTALGTCTSGRVGIPLLIEGVRVLASTPARLEHARAEYLLGRALLRLDNPKDAREHLHRSIELSALNGDRAQATRSRVVLARAGGRARPHGESPLELLTGRERRVAEMAAAGWTNQAIAEAVFLTVRTVEVHLSRVYRKLGVAGRSDLAPVLWPAPAGGFLVPSSEVGR